MPKLRAVFVLFALSTVALFAFAPSAPATEGREPVNTCLPNYDPCVKPAPDVDCAGGGGNGPDFVQGPLRVIGFDVYGLDADGDGIACPPDPDPPAGEHTSETVVVRIPAAAVASPVAGAPRFTG
jgi:hypothetical protein